MRRTSSCFTLVPSALLVIACAVAGSRPARVAAAPPGDADIDQLVRTVVDPDAGFDDRLAAEVALAALPPGRVLPVLVPQMPARPPGPPHPPAPSADADKDGPPAWLAFHAAGRAFAAHVTEDRPGLAGTLAAVLPRARSAAAREAVLRAAAAHWDAAAAEPHVAAALRDGSAAPAVRAAAAAALLRHGFDRWYPEVRGVADGAPDELQAALFRELATVGPPAGRVDAVVVMIGFRSLSRADRIDRDVDATLRRARALGDYVGVDFVPDADDPAVARAPGRGDVERIRHVTIENVRKWWAEHGRRIEDEVARVRPRPA